ncbi:MAG: hypothetical protein Q8K64_02840 [Sediminibacterium sp.]|nr:hypothetical protein [Sediminibacterium sp.]
MDNRKNIEDELGSIAPLLNSIDRTPVQHLPEGYFEQLIVPIPQSEAPIIKMEPRFKWMRYAAAAVVAGILVTGAFIYTNSSNTPFEYEQYSKMDFTAEMGQVTDEDIQIYLSAATGLTGAGHQAISDELDMPVETKLEQISDEDLLKYLSDQSEQSNYKKSS